MGDSINRPAGWYPTEAGTVRYWDGARWTDFTVDNYVAKGSSSLGSGLTSSGSHKDLAERWHRKPRTWIVVAVIAVAALAGLSDSDDSSDSSNGHQPVAPHHSATPPSAPEDESEEPTPGSEAATVVLLYITDQKDGDSFVASDGNEYRLGLVNTPEANEQCGSQAAAFTRQFLAGGFTADTYTTDTYGRHVAEVFDPSGKSLNVALAKSGLGNDRYLSQFRHENPDLGRRLDAAFASAATPSCRRAVAPVPLVQRPRETQAPSSGCMAGYSPCLPVRGDMDCGEINHPVAVTGSDPYGLDRDGDGVGCD